MSGEITVRIMRALGWTGALCLLLHAPDGTSATIRQLVEVVDINNVSVSPDGRLVAFRTEQASIERNTYETVWYVQPVDGASPPRRMGEGGEMLPDGGGSSKPELPVWSPDGKWIFFRAANDERIDLWRAAVDGSRTEQLTHDTANVRTFSLSADGSMIYYSVGATHRAVIDAEVAEYDSGFHIDRTVSLGDNLFRSGFHDGRLATQHLKNSVEYVPLLNDVPDRWKSLSLLTGVTTELAPDQQPLTPIKASDLPSPQGTIMQIGQGRSGESNVGVSEA